MQIEAAKLDELSQCVLERKKGFYEKIQGQSYVPKHDEKAT